MGNYLVEKIEKNELKILDLNKSKYKQEKLHSIFEAIRSNTSLATLHLRYNYLSDSSVTLLCDSLLFGNSSLIDLDLSYNSITEIAVKSLALLLRKNTSLKKLNLRANNVNDKGALYLADSLLTNKSLQFLNLFNTGITRVALKALREIIRVNKYLIEIKIGSNEIYGKDIEVLRKGVFSSNIPHNKVVDLRYSTIGIEGCKKICKISKICSFQILFSSTSKFKNLIMKTKQNIYS